MHWGELFLCPTCISTNDKPKKKTNINPNSQRARKLTNLAAYTNEEIWISIVLHIHADSLLVAHATPCRRRRRPPNKHAHKKTLTYMYVQSARRGYMCVEPRVFFSPRAHTHKVQGRLVFFSSFFFFIIASSFLVSLLFTMRQRAVRSKTKPYAVCVVLLRLCTV